jgi:hypothetical protein
MKTSNSLRITFAGTLLAANLLVGCAHAPTPAMTYGAGPLNKDVVPTDPLPSPFTITTSGGSIVRVAWAALTPAQKLKMLGVQDVNISVAKTDASGKLSYLTSSASAANSNYIVTLDYARYDPEDIQDELGKKIGAGYIGVGLRVRAEVHTVSANINLGSLFALAAAVQGNLAQGSLSVEVIGIDSAEVNNLFITNSSIDQTSVQKTLESVAAIQAKITDLTTTLTPQILAVEPDMSEGKTLVSQHVGEIKAALEKQL